MNTFLPFLEKFRLLCTGKLAAHGILFRKKRRHAAIQLEFPWR